MMAQKGLKVGAFALPMYTTLINADDNNLSEDEYKREFLTGMAGGIVFGWNIGENFGLRLNAIYSQQGGRYSVRKDFIDDVTFTTRLEYLKFPFMIGIQSNAEPNKIRFSFFTGFQVGILTRANTYNDNTDFEPPVPDNITRYPDAYERYEKINYSIPADIGIDIFLVDDFVMNLTLRGDYSLGDAENKDATFRVTEGGSTTYENFWPDNRAETKNFTLGILIGLTYTFARGE